MGFYLNSSALAEIALQELIARVLAQLADRLLLYLTDALTGEVEFYAYLLERHLLTAYAEEGLYDVALTVGKSAQGTLNLAGETLVEERVVGTWGVLVGNHVEEVVVLAIVEWRIDRDMTTRDTESVLNLVGWQIKLLGELFGRRFALVLLLKFGKRLVYLVE